MASPDKISVIVLSKNNARTISACLHSILKAEGWNELVIVDAHSTDGSLEIIKRVTKDMAERVKMLFDEGKGIGIARNLGVENCTGDIICFVDADACVEPEHFKKIYDYFKRNSDVGVINVVERLISGETKVQRLESLFRLVRRRLGKDIPLDKETIGAGGCFIAFRRKVYDEIGGFWTWPPYGADDKDFSLRTVEHGWKIGTIMLKSYHIPRWSLKHIIREMYGWGKGCSVFYLKHKNSKILIKVYRKRKFWIFKNPWLITFLGYLLGPPTGIIYLVQSKSITLYIYSIVRYYSFLLGFIKGTLEYKAIRKARLWNFKKS